MIINSPLEQFEIQTLIGFTSPFGDISYINITTFALYTIIILIIIWIWNKYTLENGKIISTNWNISVESLYSTIINMVKNQIGSKGMRYFPLIYTLFIFILIANLISMIPYNFAINAQLIFTISLSITIWIGVTILGLYNYKLEYFGLFVPSGCSLILVPLLVLIEGISNLARALSLGLRLGANILSGHLLITILSGLVYEIMASSLLSFFLGLLPLIIILAIVCLEFAIAAIQAYVFCILTCSYIKDALYLH